MFSRETTERSEAWGKRRRVKYVKHGGFQGDEASLCDTVIVVV